MAEWRKCALHPDVNPKTMWGCPDCLAELRRQQLTKQEAESCIEALMNGMNPASGLYFAPGWNVLLRKLEAIADKGYLDQERK